MIFLSFFFFFLLNCRIRTSRISCLSDYLTFFFLVKIIYYFNQSIRLCFSVRKYIFGMLQNLYKLLKINAPHLLLKIVYHVLLFYQYVRKNLSTLHSSRRQIFHVNLKHISNTPKHVYREYVSLKHRIFQSFTKIHAQKNLKHIKFYD